MTERPNFMNNMQLGESELTQYMTEETIKNLPLMTTELPKLTVYARKDNLSFKKWARILLLFAKLFLLKE